MSSYRTVDKSCLRNAIQILGSYHSSDTEPISKTWSSGAVMTRCSISPHASPDPLGYQLSVTYDLQI